MRHPSQWQQSQLKAFARHGLGIRWPEFGSSRVGIPRQMEEDGRQGLSVFLGYGINSTPLFFYFFTLFFLFLFGQRLFPENAPRVFTVRDVDLRKTPFLLVAWDCPFLLGSLGILQNLWGASSISRSMEKHVLRRGLGVPCWKMQLIFLLPWLDRSTSLLVLPTTLQAELPLTASFISFWWIHFRCILAVKDAETWKACTPRNFGLHVLTLSSRLASVLLQNGS